MPRNRFVVPSVTTLTLSDGDWITVKNQLTVGEERAAFQQIVGEVNATGWRRPNVELLGLAEVAAYLVAWSLRDPQGQPIPPDVSTLQLLDVESYKEIETAVEAHVKKMETERAASKNGRATESESTPILPSVASSDGPTAS